MKLPAFDLKQLSSKYTGRLALTNADADWLSYAWTMGFFRLAGFKHGLVQNPEVGNNNYMSLTCVDIPDVTPNIDDMAICPLS